MRARKLLIVLACGLGAIALFCSHGGAAPGDEGIPLHLEGAVIQTAGDSVTFMEVPIGDRPGRSGEFRYVDIECRLSLLPDGTVRVDRATAVPSARIAQSVQHFIPGAYTLGGHPLTISGPARSVGGREVWHCADSQNCVWVTGPAAGNPELDALNIPLNAVLPNDFCYGHDDRGRLIGAQSTATTFSLAWFKSNNDKAHPVYTIEHSEVWTRKLAK